MRTYRTFINRTLFVLAIFFAASSTQQAQAALVFDVIEGPGVVQVTVSGSIDLSATLGTNGTATNTSRVIRPDDGIITAGNATTSQRYLISAGGWTPFGPGNGTAGTGGGDRVALFSGPEIALPFSYSSGAALSAFGSYSGSFESLGLTVGSHVTSFSNGSNSDTVTINVIPEPHSLLMLGLGAGLLMGRRRRRLV